MTAAIKGAMATTGAHGRRPHRRASSFTLPAASMLIALWVCAPGGARAQVVCSGTGPFTCTGTQTTPFTVTAAQSPVTFDSATNITTTGVAAVIGISTGALAITNQGTLIADPSALSSLRLSNGPGMLTNFGTIGATTGAVRGIQFDNGGSIFNQASGSILGSDRGIDGNGNPINVTNSGTIRGERLQGIATNGGTVTNQTGGTITGGIVGVEVAQNLVGPMNEVTNAGTITGGTFSVQFGNSNANTLTLLTGSVLNGTAQGNGIATSLVLQGTGAANNDFILFTSLDVQASGLWALNGSSAIGAATVTSGTLVVGDATHPGASLTGAVVVNSGGALAGQGTVTGNVTVASGGTIAPGAAAPFSTLNVSGNANFASGSFFRVNANAAGQADKLSVSGMASLTGGTVQTLAQGSGFAAATPYTILHANGGFGGTSFANVTSNLAFLVPSLSYDTINNDVVLTFSSRDFVSAAQTPNQRAVAAALNASPPASTLFTSLLNQSIDGARQAFNALSGDVYANTMTVQADRSQLLRSAILGRLQQAAYSGGTANGSNVQSALGFSGPDLAYAAMDPCAVETYLPAKAPAVRGVSAHDLTFWTQGLGGFGSVKSDGNAAGTNGEFAGVLTGVDAAFGHGTRAGFAAGYTHSNVRSGTSGVDINSAQIAAYAGHTIAGPLNARGGASYSFDAIDSNRTATFPGFLDITQARFNGNVAQAFGELGYGLSLDRLALEPMAGLAYVSARQGAFGERGGPAALNGAASTENIGYSTLGLRAATLMPLANGTVLSPHASVQWQHAFGDTNPTTALAFQSTGTAFSIAGVPIAQDAALVQGGVDVRFSNVTKVTFDYQGTLAASAQTHWVKGVFSWNF